MDKDEGKVVGKADGISAADLFNLPLIHVLTVLLGLQLNTCHSRVRDILHANEIYLWTDFDNKSIPKLLKAEYNDTKSGVTFKFNRFDKERFEMVKQFQGYLNNNQLSDVNLNDPCTWSIDIWRNWRLKENLKSINSQVGVDMNVSKPETTVSAWSMPAKTLKKEASPTETLKKEALPTETLKKEASPMETLKKRQCTL